MDDYHWKMSFEEAQRFFRNMNLAEAKTFFDQYLLCREERLAQLKCSFEESSGGSSTELDYTPSSLIRLWRWAVPRIHKREYPGLGQPLSRPDVLLQRGIELHLFTDETLCLLNDIAYYFAEVCLRNLPGIRWEICITGEPRLVDEKQPVLAGFLAPMNPRELVEGAAIAVSVGNADDNALLKIFNTWSEDVGAEPDDKWYSNG